MCGGIFAFATFGTWETRLAYLSIYLSHGQHYTLFTPYQHYTLFYTMKYYNLIIIFHCVEIFTVSVYKTHQENSARKFKFNLDTVIIVIIYFL